MTPRSGVVVNLVGVTAQEHALGRAGALREISVLSVQSAPSPRSLDENTAFVEAVLRDHPNADLCVFPELFLSGYTIFDLNEIAIGRAHPLIRRLGALCLEHCTALVIGFVEDDRAGFFDSLLILDQDGEVAAVYRKTHLFGDELDAFAVGDRIETVTVAGVVVGPMICFDTEVPEVARTLRLAGAELLVTVAANMKPYGPDHELAVRARALDNRIPHVYVNRVGRESGFEFAGGSIVVGSDGTILARCDDGESVAEATVRVGDVVPSVVDYVHHLRPALYRHR